MGEVTWRFGDPARERPESSKRDLRPTCGAMSIALRLRERGLRIGLSTVLVDDAQGRRAYEAAAASGVDVGGVTLTRARSSLLLIDAHGDASPPSSESERKPPPELPRTWSSRVLLLSGLSPVLSHVAALCRAARGARRDGTVVMIDLNAALRVWGGRDARIIRMLLREVDVARCSVADLAVLGLDEDSVREALRPSATLVIGDASGGLSAQGPFGEVSHAGEGPEDNEDFLRPGAGDALVAAICADLVTGGERGESPSAFWNRALGPRPRR